MKYTKRKTILLVEDEALIAMTEKRYLEKSGYDVITADSGKKSVEIFRNNNAIDLVLMDINLGSGMDGTEAAAIILKERENPIIFLSSHTERDIMEKTEKITSYGYVVKNTGTTVLDTSIKMAFRLFEANRKIKAELKERERVEEALRASEQNQRELLKNLDRKLRESEYAQLWNVYAQSSVPTITLHRSGKIIDFNRAMAEISGYSHAEIPDLQTLMPLMYPEEDDLREIFEAYIKPWEQGNSITRDEFVLTTKAGEKRYVNISVYDIMHQDRPTDIQVVQCEDVTENKIVKQALSESEMKYRALFKSMGQGFYLSDILYDEEGVPCDYRYVDVNSAFEQIIGLNRDKIIDKTYNELVPLDPESGWLDCFKRVATTGVPENYGFPSKIYNCYFETYAFRPEEGKFAALVKDVTDRTLAEEKIQNLLQEKDLILREVHHRIKNNMHVIHSLLMLHSDEQINPDSKKVLYDVASRIRSMMLLYDKLYRSDNIGELSIKHFVPSLIDEIVEIFPNSASVKIETRMDDIILDAKVLSALGIIVNELVTNAMKFAFQGRSSGKINVSASVKHEHVVMELEDDGIGLPESVGFENTTGFGMQLVGMLVKQINGSISIKRNRGTTFIIQFKK